MKKNKEKLTIRMSDHAYRRALERGISDEDIQRIINNPIDTIYDTYEENYELRNSYR